MKHQLRSSFSTQGRRMAGARALWTANGMKKEQMGKPIIAIVNSFTQFVPGHVHLHEIGQFVKKEIEKQGCFAAEFNTIAIDDGIAMGHDGMLYSLSECIQKAKSFEYPNDATAMFAEKVLEKYSRSIMQIDSASLSTEKSIWVYAHDYLDLSVYEERLKLSAGSLDDSKNAIQKDMKAFVDISLKSINLAMNTKYSFYLSSIELKNFDFDNGSLSARFELTINFC